LSPQQYAAPVSSSPQVWPWKNPPAAISWKVKPLLTLTGTELAVVVPSPSCPRLLRPQQ
jgi:hypothetical protein